MKESKKLIGEILQDVKRDILVNDERFKWVEK